VRELGQLSRIPGEDSKEKNRFLNIKDFLNLARLGKILQGDLGGILI
jgi:hypothetical protein